MTDEPQPQPQPVTWEAAPLLPDMFWDARPRLQHISNAARANNAPRDAVLGACLARVLWLTPHQIIPPTTINKYGSLNAIICLLGASGTGKGNAINVATDLIADPHPADPLTGIAGNEVSYPHTQIGASSGEGLGAVYWERELDELGHKAGWRRRNYGVLQRVDEGEEAIKIGQRAGSTLWTQMRQAWSGQQLGFENATDAHNRRQVAQGSYRYVMLVGFQPATVGALLDDAAGGTPQRFTWFQSIDPGIGIGEAVEDPGPIDWRPPRWENSPDNAYLTVLGQQRRPMTIDPAAGAELLERALAGIRGELGALDGHSGNVQLKLACALALLEGRLHVVDEDWWLAEMVMAVSECVRGIAVEHQRAEQASAAADRAHAQAVAHVTAVSAALDEEGARIQRVTDNVRRHLGRQAMTKRELEKNCIYRPDRPYLDRVLRVMVADGEVERVGTQLRLSTGESVT